MATIAHPLDCTEQRYTDFYMEGGQGVRGCRIRTSIYIYMHTHRQFRKMHPSTTIAQLWERRWELRMNKNRRESVCLFFLTHTQRHILYYQ